MQNDPTTFDNSAPWPVVAPVGLTSAQELQASKLMDDIKVLTRDMSGRHLLTVLLGVAQDRGDVTGADLEELGNELGRIGHLRGRMTKGVNHD